MKLHLLKSKGFGPVVLTTLQRAFDVAMYEYGISSINGTVRLKINLHPEIDEIVLTGNVMASVKTTEGRTATDVLPGNIVDVVLSPTQGVDQLLQTWCHELRHVSQILTGRLTGGPLTGAVWLGKTYSKREMKKLGHDKWPWEVEAEAEANRILPKVIADLKDYVNSPEGSKLLDQETEKTFGTKLP